MQFLTLVFGLWLILLLGVLAWRDAREMRLPNVWSGLLAASGLAHAGLIKDPEPLEAMAASLLAAALLSGVFFAYRSWRRIDGLGIGDIKLVAAGTLWFGFAGLGPMLLVATASAGLFVLMRAWRRGGVDVKERIPFGPFLAIGIFTAWLLTHVSLLAQSLS